MPMMTKQQQVFDQSAQSSQTIPFVTLGLVVDTNDPQQMGRVRVVCSQWGDAWGSKVEDLPWAIYMTPFGGQVQVGTRGPGIQESEGGVAYGMWAIPKVGSQVAVLCIDGDPMSRMYFGCVYDQFTPHTMPHGRYMYEDHPSLEKSAGDTAPFGPFTSSETLIQPLADNVRRAFGVNDVNHEFRTRGADYSVSRVDVSQLSQTYTKVQDDKDVQVDGWVSTQGYQVSRTDPNAPSSFTDRNYDSLVYAFTSPGFHALSMDDRQENCRVRLRTTSGHQILMDDTNERIYISTAQGNNWIELDQDGNIDVFTSNKLNIHAAKDINLTSDETIRMFAKKGIHMHSEDEIRVNAVKDISVKTDASIRSHSSVDTCIQADANIQIKGGQLVNVTSGSTLNLRSSADLKLTAAGTVHVLGGPQVLVTAGAIHLNGPGASSAATASAAGETIAFYTNRVPTHEPFARVMTKDDTTHEPEFSYDDSNVGRAERGRTIARGSFWRR